MTATIAMADAIRVSGARTVGDALPAGLRPSTDTRSLAPGDAFVALRGERFDGHDYLAAALAAGASLVVVDDAATVPAGASALVVNDTTHAYLAFASVARERSAARVVGVTGSAGKTTTKAFLAQLLERIAPGRVAATPRNENNEIGVAKRLLDLPSDAAFAVVEFGARHAGDIEPLARAARPETAVLTNVGEAHLEIFGSREALAETKWAVFAGGARRVLNAGDAESRARAARDGVATIWFGTSADPAAPAGERSVVIAGREGLRLSGFRDAALNRTFPARVAVAGDHNVSNAAAAAAAAIDLGVDPERVVAALADLELPAGRYERSSVGAFAVIYDAYNANPSGMHATLASFAREVATRHIAVLSSMAEIGADAAAHHRAVGASAAGAGVWTLLVGGDFADDLAAGARAAGMDAARIVPFSDNAAAVAWLRANARAGDLVLIKGSRRYRLEDVVDGLRAARVG
jgi:UDP-N-acetylmuramoyl-tripeptide--D-alanyl-D-alanine ligase